jgi:hypothetical protein
MTNMKIGDLIESLDAKGIYVVEMIKTIQGCTMFSAGAADTSCEYASIGGSLNEERLTIIVGA